MTQPTQGGQKEKQAIEIQCVKCNSIFIVTAPTLMVINHRAFSQVTISHENAERCPKCHACFVPVIQREGINKFEWNWVAIADDEKRVIAPPTGLISV